MATDQAILDLYNVGPTRSAALATGSVRLALPYNSRVG
jgi:hypothetical protein